MNSPTIISVASIIPGLGLWLIGKRRESIIAAVLVFSTLLIFLFSPWRPLASLSCNIAVFLWVMQSIYAGYEARVAKSLASGSVQPVRETTPILPPPSDLSRFEKQSFKAKEIVRQQLEVGEHILDAIPASQMSSLHEAGSYRLYYVGLLQDKLAVVSTDFLGKPAGIERTNFSSIEDLYVTYGLLQDTLTILLDPDGFAEFRVSRWLRTHTDNFVSSFNKQKGLQA